MKSNVIRTLVGGLSFTSAMFVFQACYGTPQDFYVDVLIEGQVKSAKTNSPIKGILVTAVDNQNSQLTDENGNFSFYTYGTDTLKLRFDDIDAAQNGSFKSKDTLISNPEEKIVLEILLEEN